MLHERLAHHGVNVVAELPELRPVLQAILAARDRAARRAGFTALNDYWHEHLGRVWRLVREATAVDTEVTEWIKQFFREQRAMIQAELERCGVPASDASATPIPPGTGISPANRLDAVFTTMSEGSGRL